MATLLVMDKGVAVERLELTEEKTYLGRAPNCEVVVDDETVSNVHAVIEALDDPNHEGAKEYYIRDLDSTNHTYLNDKPITHQRIHTNDVVRVGWMHLKFVDENEKSYEKTKKIHKSWIPGIFYTK